MSNHNIVDCCFDCVKQFNKNLCENYCHTKEFCGDRQCDPGGCPNFESKFNVTISKEEYDNLLADSHFLDVLYQFGLENWNNYDSAFDEAFIVLNH